MKIFSEFNKFFNKKPNFIFLIDGLGALLSASLLIVLSYWVDLFGMPKDVLYKLFPIPLFLAFFSISNYLIQPKIFSFRLWIVAMANLMYCILSFSLVIYFYDILTGLGVLYFFSEKFIILVLVFIELRICKNEYTLN
ncbi:hypothetical protein [Leptospira sp. GIMC2001]|uniref:hypothetical protein n=1 Tax=Leptospira sp. GIMC2001 TaxID=1513297 RepID=UPI0023493D41|nr:hypothetical protein [Leptospira sp. GIMC2001]WCL48483.1 hypothetical protein O4O04_14385 [Leptospira sp. GIMC2001]